MFAIVAYIYKSNTFILNSLLINWANFNFLLSMVSKICSHFLKDNRESLELQLIIINYKTFVKQRIPYWIHLLIWVLLLYLRNCKTLISWNPLHNMILKVDLIRECMATWPFFYCRWTLWYQLIKLPSKANTIWWHSDCIFFLMQNPSTIFKEEMHIMQQVCT